ncbi:unnamed protein product [Camellia sinensis]
MGRPQDGICHELFPLAAILASGRPIPLPPLFLGGLYRRLDMYQEGIDRSKGRYDVTSFLPTTFLQLFLYERFPSLAPMPKVFSIEKSEPRSARWAEGCVQGSLASIFDFEDKFVAHPYVMPVCGVSSTVAYRLDDYELVLEPGVSYLGDADSAMVLSTVSGYLPYFLDGTYGVVAYHPLRVARQVGLDQGVPQHLPSPVPSAADCMQLYVYSFLLEELRRRGRVVLASKGRIGGTTPSWRKYWRCNLALFRAFLSSDLDPVHVELIPSDDPELCMARGDRGLSAADRGELSPLARLSKVTIALEQSQIVSPDRPSSAKRKRPPPSSVLVPVPGRVPPQIRGIGPPTKTRIARQARGCSTNTIDSSQGSAGACQIKLARHKVLPIGAEDDVENSEDDEEGSDQSLEVMGARDAVEDDVEDDVGCDMVSARPSLLDTSSSRDALVPLRDKIGGGVPIACLFEGGCNFSHSDVLSSRVGGASTSVSLSCGIGSSAPISLHASTTSAGLESNVPTIPSGSEVGINSPIVSVGANLGGVLVRELFGFIQKGASDIGGSLQRPSLPAIDGDYSLIHATDGDFSPIHLPRGSVVLKGIDGKEKLLDPAVLFAGVKAELLPRLLFVLHYKPTTFMHLGSSYLRTYFLDGFREFLKELYKLSPETASFDEVLAQRAVFGEFRDGRINRLEVGWLDDWLSLLESKVRRRMIKAELGEVDKALVVAVRVEEERKLSFERAQKALNEAELASSSLREKKAILEARLAGEEEEDQASRVLT